MLPLQKNLLTLEFQHPKYLSNLLTVCCITTQTIKLQSRTKSLCKHTNQPALLLLNADRVTDVAYPTLRTSLEHIDIQGRNWVSPYSQSKHCHLGLHTPVLFSPQRRIDDYHHCGFSYFLVPSRMYSRPRSNLPRYNR